MKSETVRPALLAEGSVLSKILDLVLPPSYVVTVPRDGLIRWSVASLY